MLPGLVTLEDVQSTVQGIFFKKASDVLQINVVTSEFFLLSLVETTGTFHVFLTEIYEKSNIFTEVTQARVYNSN